MAEQPLGIRALKINPTDAELQQYVRELADIIARSSKETVKTLDISGLTNDVESIQTENAETQITIQSLQDQIDNLRERIEALGG